MILVPKVSENSRTAGSASGSDAAQEVLTTLETTTEEVAVVAAEGSEVDGALLDALVFPDLPFVLLVALMVCQKLCLIDRKIMCSCSCSWRLPVLCAVFMWKDSALLTWNASCWNCRPGSAGRRPLFQISWTVTRHQRTTVLVRNLCECTTNSDNLQLWKCQLQAFIFCLDECSVSFMLRIAEVRFQQRREQ
jgi:hypothetical protein